MIKYQKENNVSFIYLQRIVSDLQESSTRIVTTLGIKSSNVEPLTGQLRFFVLTRILHKHKKISITPISTESSRKKEQLYASISWYSYISLLYIQMCKKLRLIWQLLSFKKRLMCCYGHGLDACFTLVYLNNVFYKWE